MSQLSQSKKMSKLEWFGLLSGVVGLIADVIALLTLFKIFQVTQSFPTQYISPSSFILWIIILFGIAYAILIVSFYTRRVLVCRHRRKSKYLSYSKKNSIDTGIFAITALVGVPLFLLHLILLFYMMGERLHGTDTEHLERFFGSPDATRIVFYIGSRWFLLAPLLAFTFSLFLHLVAEKIYSALDEDLEDE